MAPEAQSPTPLYTEPSFTPSLVLVCANPSMLVQRTLSPSFAFVEAGDKARPPLPTSCVGRRALPDMTTASTMARGTPSTVTRFIAIPLRDVGRTSAG